MSTTEHSTIDVEKEAYVLDSGERTPSDAGTKTAADGHTVLSPQPTNDPNDPLNWSTGKKHLFLFIVSFAAFLPDYGSATGAITNLVQPETWPLPETVINEALVGNLAMLAIGGLFVIVLSSWIGRLPVLFWFSVIAFATAAWSAGATSFESFMTARILNGFFATVTQAGGLMFIKDLFFFHEHPRKINIWSAFIVFSPYFGPFVASWIVWKSVWPWCYWILTILWGIVIILIVAFMDETYYNRNIPVDQQPERKSRMMRLIGVEQWKSRSQRNTLYQSILRPAAAICKIPVILISLYYVFTFAWVIGLNAAIGFFLAEFYKFGPEATALFYFAPLTATVLGEIAGHFVFDMTASLYTKRHNGRIEPETRLIPVWFATPLMIMGIVLLGFSLENLWHYMATAVCWGLYVFGIMICTTSINAYLLDAYPEASGEVAAWINFGRTLGGFIIAYYEIDWVLAEGPQTALGIQAAIVAAAFFIIVFLQFFGRKIRLAQGKILFTTEV